MRTLESMLFSGHLAKRRIHNCAKPSLLACYLQYNTENTSNYFLQQNIKHVNGIYKKISGDIHQPDTLEISEDHKYKYRKNGVLIYQGNHPKTLNSVGYEALHYDNTGNMISKSKIVYDKAIGSNMTEARTIGEAYHTGKFGKYVGKYTATHIYHYIYDKKEVIYNNVYNFENGQTSSATYSLLLK
jgi:hypothetical protein